MTYRCQRVAREMTMLYSELGMFLQPLLLTKVTKRMKTCKKLMASGLVLSIYKAKVVVAMLDLS